MSESQSNSTKSSHLNWKISFIVLGLFAALLLASALNPEIRVKIRARLFPDEKVLLATVSGELLNDGTIYKVLKFRTSRGLIVEIHGPSSQDEGAFTLVDRVVIPDLHDGYFQLAGQPTRLAIVDMDNDGTLEIVAPSFDENLVAHLNALKLSPEGHKLELVKPTSPSP